MIEKILPKRYVTQNCIENCIANLCDALDVDFRPMFLFSWDFGFKKYESTLGEKIHYHTFFDIGVEQYFKISEDYLGIKFIDLPKTYNNIINSIKSNIVLLIRADSFNVSWSLGYLKYHLPHFYLLMCNEGKICVIDSFSCQEILHIEDIPVDDIEQCYYVETYQLTRLHSTELLKNGFLTFLKNNLDNGVFDLIKHFGKELTEIDSIDKLTIAQTDIPNAMLIRRLSYITNSRYNTKCFFEYIDYAKYYVDVMQSIYERWETVKNLFIKILISKKISLLEQVGFELIQIINLENNLCKNIISENEKFKK